MSFADFLQGSRGDISTAVAGGSFGWPLNSAATQIGMAPDPSPVSITYAQRIVQHRGRAEVDGAGIRSMGGPFVDGQVALNQRRLVKGENSGSAYSGRILPGVVQRFVGDYASGVANDMIGFGSTPDAGLIRQEQGWISPRGYTGDAFLDGLWDSPCPITHAAFVMGEAYIPGWWIDDDPPGTLYPDGLLCDAVPFARYGAQPGNVASPTVTASASTFTDPNPLLPKVIAPFRPASGFGSGPTAQADGISRSFVPFGVIDTLSDGTPGDSRRFARKCRDPFSGAWASPHYDLACPPKVTAYFYGAGYAPSSRPWQFCVHGNMGQTITLSGAISTAFAGGEDRYDALILEQLPGLADFSDGSQFGRIAPTAGYFNGGMTIAVGADPTSPSNWRALAFASIPTWRPRFPCSLPNSDWYSPGFLPP